MKRFGTTPAVVFEGLRSETLLTPQCRHGVLQGLRHSNLYPSESPLIQNNVQIHSYQADYTETVHF